MIGSLRTRIVATVAATALLAFGVTTLPAVADTLPASPTIPVTVSADGLPTPQINGVAWSQAVVGDIVYVAGKFTTARPAGSAAGVNTVPRNNLLAYNIETGELVTSFAPNLNAQALAVTASPDGSRIYVAGDFTSVDGVAYYRIAAFSTATGQVIPTFKPILGSQGRAISATNSTVYIGGTFRTVNGAARSFLASVNASNGATTSWTANTDAVVDAITLTKDGTKLVAGGRFTVLAGANFRGLGAVNATTGAAMPWPTNAVVRNAGVSASITSLTATADAVYGTGYAAGKTGGNFEGLFSANPSTGALNWLEDCHGDSYSSFALGDAVYVSSHAHYCGNIGGFPNSSLGHYATAFTKARTGTVTKDNQGYWNFGGQPAPTLLDWFPTLTPGTFTGQGQAGWSVSGNSKYVVYGGEFTHVNGVAQQGLVRFAVPSAAPNKSGPTVTTALVPSVSSTVSGQVKIAWTTTHDHDNANLTYTLVRDEATATPIYVATKYSNFYKLSAMSFTDTGVAPATTHTYRLYVTDGWGNSISRLSASVKVAGTPGANLPPVAAFTTSSTALAATFSAAASSDSDGTIAQYSWNFGDGGTATGVSASHTYAAAGTYTVTLTVRDDDGAAATASKSITVTTTTPPVGAVLGQDQFERTVASGWGSAPIGGAWTVAGAASALSVSAGTGQVALAAGSTRTMTLASISSTSTDSTMNLALNSVPTGGGSYTSIFGRQVGANNYAGNVWVKSTGAVALVLKQGATVLSNTAVAGVTYTAGMQLQLRIQVTGTSPTTVQAKVWQVGQPEPATWLSSVTDSTAALQTAGSVAIQASLSASSTAGSVTRIDNFETRPPH